MPNTYIIPLTEVIKLIITFYVNHSHIYLEASWATQQLHVDTNNFWTTYKKSFMHEFYLF